MFYNVYVPEITCVTTESLLNSHSAGLSGNCPNKEEGESADGNLLTFDKVS